MDPAHALLLLPPVGRAPRAACGDGVDDDAPLDHGDWVARLPRARGEDEHVRQEQQADHANNDETRCAALSRQAAEALEALDRTL